MNKRHAKIEFDYDDEKKNHIEIIQIILKLLRLEFRRTYTIHFDKEEMKNE